MEPVSSQYYYCENEDRRDSLHQRPPFSLPPPPSSSSSCSSALREPQQTASTTEGAHHPASGSSTAPFVEKEHMFDKVVTPSDVGKLNRLVIPKQHAEKYFPLGASAGEKGLLLSFEDRTGNHWRFRYSYWNSSQSYVMTKGWSRFVKEKRLDAGDTVSFGRGIGEAGRHRLFIDWKHRPDVLASQPLLHHLPLPFHSDHLSLVVPFARSAVPWGTLLVPPTSSAVSAMSVYDYLCYGHNPAVSSNPFFYLRSAGNPSQDAVQLGMGSGGGGGGEGGLAMPVAIDMLPAVQRGSAVAKTVRLFGVNLDCSPSEGEPGTDAAPHGHALPAALAASSPHKTRGRGGSGVARAESAASNLGLGHVGDQASEINKF